MRFVLQTASVMAVFVLGCGDGLAPDYPDQPAPTPHPSVIAFVNVRVVHAHSGGVTRRQTVIVRDGTISTVGPWGTTPLPNDAFLIDGHDRYLMPGLVDMHVHMTEDTFEELRNDYLLYLANGVTAIRVMWGSRTLVRERDSVRAGTVLGPDLFVASPGLDGPGGPWSGFTPPVSTPAEARTTVADHVASGYDFIKIYNLLAPDVYDAIVDEASQFGIPLVGHVPGRVGLERVQDVGQRTSEHLIGLKLAASNVFTGGTIDVARVRTLAARSAAGGVRHTPTITVDALSRSERIAIGSGTEIEFVAPGVREFFADGFHHGLDDALAARERGNHELMIRELHAAGAKLLVGTDAGFGWILPGFSIHDELAGIAAAGLTPAEVLQAAVVNSADALGASGRLGHIAGGFDANLVLVPSNPLDDLGAIRMHDGVMIRGRWLSRGSLDEALEAIRAGY